MTDMPKIVTHLTGDVSGLAKAVGEGEILVDRYGETVERKTKEHGERAGEAGGKGLTEKLEEELGRPTVTERPLAGISKRVQDKFTEMGKKSGDGFVKNVEVEVKTLETKLQSLADEMMRTGNFDLMKEFKTTEGDLGVVTRVRKEFERVREEAAKFKLDLPGDGGNDSNGGFFSGLVRSISTALRTGATEGMKLAKQVMELGGPEMGLLLAAGVVAAGPAIGAALNAALALGVGGAGITVGIIAAAQDPRVKSAWSGAMNSIFAGYKDAARPLVEPLIDGAGKIQSAFARAMPLIETAMDHAAPIVDKLITGVERLIDRVGPGLAYGFDAVLPVLDQFAEDLPMIGDMAGEFFALIGDGGEGAAMGLHDLIVIIGAVVLGFTQMVSWAAQAYEKLRDLSVIGPVVDLIQAILPAGEDAKEGFDKTADGAGNASGEIDKAKKSLSDFISEAFAMQDSQLALQKGLFDIADAFEKNGSSLDINTEKGLANRQAMQRQIETIARWRQEQLDAGKSPAYVNSEIDRQIRLMYEDAKAHGANTAQLEALIRQWRTILELPAYKQFNVTTIANRIDAGNPVGAGVRVQRFGGIVRHAASGMITQPGIYQGHGDGFTVMAEQETNKEGYVPQNAPAPVALSLMSEMASWKGWGIDTSGGRRVQPVERPAPASQQAPTIVVPVRVDLDGRVIYETMIHYDADMRRNDSFSGVGS